jgi:peptidoglycan/xylan/chitin deacetylase (PgdA/CDA1 family)
MSASRTLVQQFGARVRRFFAPPTIVLLYHRVVPHVGRDPNLLCISTANFAAHLAWLRRYCCVLNEADFLDQFFRPRRTRVALDGGKPRVLVTFDDGYADNHHHALPILAEHGVQAIVFASSDLIGSDQPFWWDAVEQLTLDHDAPAEGWQLPKGLVVPPTHDRHHAFRTIQQTLKYMRRAPRADALAALAEQAGQTPSVDNDLRPMTWDELRAWHAAGQAVGAHTQSHPQLSALEDEDIREELVGCKRRLEAELGVTMNLLAYPFGAAGDYDDRCERIAREIGFKGAFANRPANARWTPSDFAIPRCLVRNWTLDELLVRFRDWCA